MTESRYANRVLTTETLRSFVRMHESKLNSKLYRLRAGRSGKPDDAMHYVDYDPKSFSRADG